MSIFSLLGIVIIVLVILFFGRVASFLTKVLFMALLIIFALVLFFGISFNQVFDWVTSAVLWGF